MPTASLISARSSASASASSSRQTTDNTSRRLMELRGIERTMTWRPDASFKIVHAMGLAGSSDALQKFMAHVEEALMHTFNRHPRMRAKMVEDKFAVVEIYPQLTLADIGDQKLLVVTTVSDTNTTDMEHHHWQAFAQQQCEIPFNRVAQFAFQLHVWVDDPLQPTCLRLFLFSDHSISDGASGSTILHDVLATAAALSIISDNNQLQPEPENEFPPHFDREMGKELPLYGSAYAQMLSSRRLLHPVLKGMMVAATKPFMKHAPKLHPVILPRAGHQDLCIPPVENASSMLFASGTSANLALILHQCRQQHATFFGVLTAAILVSFALVAKQQSPEDAATTTNFQLKADASFNMRGRVTKPVPANTVGSYAFTAPLAKLFGGKGFDLATKSFWQVARDATQEARATASTFAMTAIPMIAVDRFYHANTKTSFWQGLEMPYASMADVNVSSVGAYPYQLVHSFGANDKSSQLTITSLHYNCRVPFLATLSQFYVTSIGGDRGGIGYSLGHTYEPEVGQELLETLVTIMENHVDHVDTHATLADVMAAVRQEKAKTITAE